MKLKRRIILSAVSVFCAAAVTVASLPYNAALAAATATTTDYLNLRTGAGTDKKVILSLSKGVSVTVLDNSDPVWAKVKTASGLTGYCHKQYLSISGASAAAPTNDAKVASGTAAVTTSNLNLRNGAGGTNAIIVTISKGTSVKVIDSANADWYKVQTSDGKLGYCTSQFLQIAAPSASQTAAQTGNSAVPASSATAVATDYVNLRQGAGSSYKVLETVSKGTSLKVLDSSNAQWTKVQTPSGKQGYCSKQYLSFSNTSASPSSNTASPAAGGSTASGTKILTGTATSSINLRSGAGSTFSVIATLPKGTVVTVTDNSNNVWAKVKTSDGKQGYCSKSFLKIASSTQQSTPPATTPTNPTTPTTPTTPAPVKTLIGTTTSGLNLRSGAGTSYKVVVCLAKGATVTVIDNSNATWAKVKTADGKTGYCQKKYLKITEKTTPQTNTNTGTGTNTNTNTGVDTNNGSTDNGTNSGSTAHTITGASVTADLLRLREQPNSNANVVTNLPKGTSLTVLEATNSTWTKVQTSSGQVGYVCTQYIKIHYSDDSDSVTDSTGLLSASSCSIPLGKTLYIKASGSASVTWTSSDPSIATVSNGYVYAAAKGSAVITATNGTDTATCNITVTDAEPVKTAYASPNIASTGAQVTFTAVTDSTRDAVQFVITMQDGTTRTLDTTNYTEETMLNTVTRKWMATTTFDTAGTYSFTALSSLNGVMSSSGFKTNAYVSNQQNFTTTTDEER
ncbi:MAG TPA: SH3 domain-containing protein, partial [Caproiciproducens sp.]|nr:SH3 domain-containing protein [Caproiciproducens sp.]